MDKQKEIVNNVKEAIDEKDSGKLKKALADFKKWFFGGDPEAKWQGLKMALLLLYMMLGGFVGGYAGGTIFGGIVGLSITKGKNKSFIFELAKGILLIFAVIKTSDSLVKQCNKEQAKYIDEYIKKAEDKLEKLEDELDNTEDTKSEEYKTALKIYKTTQANLSWLKRRKVQIDNSTKLSSAKADIKDAKKYRKYMRDFRKAYENVENN